MKNIHWWLFGTFMLGYAIGLGGPYGPWAMLIGFGAMAVCQVIGYRLNRGL